MILCAVRVGMVCGVRMCARVRIYCGSTAMYCVRGAKLTYVKFY